MKERLPRVGDLLWRGCSCDDFAKVLRVGVDDNGTPVLDVELCDGQSINEIHCAPDVEGMHEGSNLMRIKVPPGPVQILEVPWRPLEGGGIDVAFVDGMCWRCTRLFFPHSEGESPFGEVSA